MIKVPFGEYLPDVQPTENPGLTVATNCLPGVTSYKQMLDLSAYSSNALSDVPVGAISAKDVSGNTYTYAGTRKKLYKLESAAWTDSTRASGTYTTAIGGYWEMEPWGNFILATNGVDEIQEVTLGATQFSMLSGTPPIARHIGIVRDFVVLGHVTDLSSGSTVPNRVHWSGFNNSHTWTPSLATQADYQDLNSKYGAVQRIVGGEIGVVFQEYAITRMLYVGAPIIWQFDTVETNRGTRFPHSVVKVGGNVFYLGHDDFYVFNGASSTPLGQGKIFNTFKADFNDAAASRLMSAIASVNDTVVIWSYVGVDGTSKLIAYNWVSNRWAGPINISVYKLFHFLAEGYTLDSLDAFNNNIDTYQISFDDDSLLGGMRHFAAMDSNYKLATFTGSPLTAVFETGDKRLIEGKKALVTSINPLIEGVSASASVAVSSRLNTKDTHSFSANVSVNSEGECPILIEGRYHKFRVTVAGGFDHAYGLEVEGGPGGRY